MRDASDIDGHDDLPDGHEGERDERVADVDAAPSPMAAMRRRVGGNHSAVCSARLEQAIELGLEPALAFLTLARGTGPDQRTTAWGVNAMEERDILGRIAGRRAFQTLEKSGLVSPPAKRHRRKLADAVTLGVGADGKPAPAPRIWFPNVLVDGLGAGRSPLAIIRETRSAGVLKLLMRLYQFNDLAGCAGVSPQHLRWAIRLEKLGERAEFAVFGLAGGGPTASSAFAAPWLTGRMTEVNGRRQDEGFDAFFSDLDTLDATRLVENIAYIFDAAPGEGEAILPAGGGEDAERAHYDAMRAAAHRMMTRTERTGKKQGDVLRGYSWLAAVRRHVRTPHAAWIVRPRYLPDTEPTRAWLARLERWRARAEGWSDT